MRIFAWLGILCLVFAIFNSFYASISISNIQGDNIGYIYLYAVAYYFALFGLLIFLIGGLILKPPLLSIAAIVLGITYIVSFFCTFVGDIGWGDWTGVLLPGLIYIVSGLSIMLLNLQTR